MGSKIFLGLTIVVLASFGAYKIFFSQTTPAPPTTDQPITVTGEVVCLLSKNNQGIQTMGCAIGLKLTDGTYLGLNNIQNDLVSGKFTNGDQIEVTGIQNNDSIKVTSTRVIKKGIIYVE